MEGSLVKKHITINEKRKSGIILSLILLGLGMVFFWWNQLRKEQEMVQEPIEHRLQWWLSAIGWDAERTDVTGEGIRIAILDSGVDAEHPDLEGVIEKEYRVSGLGVTHQESRQETQQETQQESHQETNQDSHQKNLHHGTAVAGIIAASPSTDKGALGVAVNASILSVDITDEANGIIQVEHLIEGIEYAIQESVDIINISAGIKEDSEELHEVIQRAYEAGIVVVAAAGNFMEDDILYPARYEEVLAVGAQSRNNEIISPTGNLPKSVSYLPGESIVTTGVNGKYIGADGTSVATPIMTGIVALMLEANQTLTNEEILQYFNSNQSSQEESEIEQTIQVRYCIQLKD